MTGNTALTADTAHDHRQHPDSYAHGAWGDHAVALAIGRGMRADDARWRTAHPVTRIEDYTGQEVFAVASQRLGAARTYRVFFHGPEDRLRCECPAGGHGKPCSHAGAVILHIRLEIAAFRQTLAAERETDARIRYEKTCEWIEEMYPTRRH